MSCPRFLVKALAQSWSSTPPKVCESWRAVLGLLPSTVYCHWHTPTPGPHGCAEYSLIHFYTTTAPQQWGTSVLRNRKDTCALLCALGRTSCHHAATLLAWDKVARPPRENFGPEIAGEHWVGPLLQNFCHL